MNPENVKMMPVKALKPHPLQGSLYSECGEADDAVLLADLKANGQRDPVVVMPAGNKAGLPANTILDGHRRLRLLQSLGHKQVRVLVRDDLKSSTAAEVEAAFIGFNFSRRQLATIDKARLAKRQYELEVGRISAGKFGQERIRLKDRIGKTIGMTGRNLDRYLRVLEAPIEIQNAVRDGLLKLVAGSRVAALAKDSQNDLVLELAGQTDRKVIERVVGNYVSVPGARTQASSADVYRDFVKNIRTGLNAIAGREKSIAHVVIARQLPTLEQASSVLEKLIKRGKAANGPFVPPAALQKLVADQMRDAG